MAEEDNLLAAWRLARQYGWWSRVISAMQGLRTLYLGDGTQSRLAAAGRGRHAGFCRSDTDRPLPGREDEWSLVTEYRVLLAKEERDLDKAERLQRLRVDWDRERASAALATAPEQRSDSERNAIRTLAASVQVLGDSTAPNE